MCELQLHALRRYARIWTYLSVCTGLDDDRNVSYTQKYTGVMLLSLAIAVVYHLIGQADAPKGKWINN